VDAGPASPAAPPHPDEVKAAIAGMTYDDAVAYIASLYGRGAGVVSAAPRAAGGTDTIPMGAGGATFVARRPTMFMAGGRQFLVGEDTRHGHPSGADELVSISGDNGRTVVHVDPLQRRGTGIPPAVAATANLAVPGSPYRPKVGLPASAVHPGQMSYADAPALEGRERQDGRERCSRAARANRADHPAPVQRG
jgi:hypothetical protein